MSLATHTIQIHTDNMYNSFNLKIKFHVWEHQSVYVCHLVVNKATPHVVDCASAMG